MNCMPPAKYAPRRAKEKRDILLVARIPVAGNRWMFFAGWDAFWRPELRGRSRIERGEVSKQSLAAESPWMPRSGRKSLSSLASLVSYMPLANEPTVIKKRPLARRRRERRGVLRGRAPRESDQGRRVPAKPPSMDDASATGGRSRAGILPGDSGRVQITATASRCPRLRASRRRRSSCAPCAGPAAPSGSRTPGRPTGRRA